MLMVACRSPKPKMGVRLTPCLFGNVRESMGERLNLQICEFTGRKRALPEILLIGVRVAHWNLTPAERVRVPHRPFLCICRLGAEWYCSGLENRGPKGHGGSNPSDGV